jgi:hypothetical protein
LLLKVLSIRENGKHMMYYGLTYNGRNSNQDGYVSQQHIIHVCITYFQQEI